MGHYRAHAVAEGTIEETSSGFPGNSQVTAPT